MDLMQYLLIISFQVIIGTNGQTSGEGIEHCIDSNYHKKLPAKEDNLHKQCLPWKEYSCCTEKTSMTAHETRNHYKFNFNHCQHPMTEKCKKHFIQDLCFYECEPFLKPWVKKVNRSFARERIFQVPICSSDCDLWWSDCKDDYTCVYNWARSFNWSQGTNQCPPKAECKPIHQIYSSAQDFCEKVWDDSWQYTTEDKPCMRIWFNGTKGNPNKATAQYYQSLAINSSNHLLVSHVFYAFVLFLLVLSL